MRSVLDGRFMVYYWYSAEGNTEPNQQARRRKTVYFYDQMFNPNTVNPQYYNSVRSQFPLTDWEQNIEIVKAVKAVHDLWEAVKKMDLPHQQVAFIACLQQMGNDMGWK